MTFFWMRRTRAFAKERFNITIQIMDPKQPSKTIFGPKRFQLYIKKIIIINDDE